MSGPSPLFRRSSTRSLVRGRFRYHRIEGEETTERIDRIAVCQPPGYVKHGSIDTPGGRGDLHRA